MIILAAIGDITRFGSPKKLVGYAGLGASVHSSGKTYRTGHITRPRRARKWLYTQRTQPNCAPVGRAARSLDTIGNARHIESA